MEATHILSCGQLRCCTPFRHSMQVVIVHKLQRKKSGITYTFTSSKRCKQISEEYLITTQYQARTIIAGRA
jgi:hypothetical protein